MFVHLRLHTEFSVVDGTNRIDDVVKAAAADGQPALGITDLNNLFGAIKFYKAARGAGLKPLIGAELMLQGLGTDENALSRVLVLVQNRRRLPEPVRAAGARLDAQRRARAGGVQAGVAAGAGRRA
jgi:DNA polymerase-3 subunit alpha